MSSPDPDLPEVSVVVPCRDAAATLPRQLTALVGQATSRAWELILADNGSTDDSVALAHAAATTVPLRVVDAGQRDGAAHARNRGASEARGGVLLFCDADDEVAPGWLEAMAHGVQNHGFVASRFEVARLNSPAVAAAHRHPQEHGLNPYTYPPYLPHAGGAGLGIRRAWHQELGGFDEDLPALEDTDYCWRQHLAGRPLHFAGDAVVHVRVKDSLAADFRQLYRYGIYNVLIYRRYRSRGMPRLAPTAGLARWAKLLLTAPRLLTRDGRAAWVPQSGWRLGRLVGSLRYRVLAL